jgi:hypothetical protein
MRVLRFSTLLATLVSFAVGAHLAACGNDDPGVDPQVPTPEAGTDSVPTVDSSVPTPTPSGPTLTVSTSRAKLYLGQTAKIEGATIAPEITSKHAWTLVAAPSNSAIKTESIQNAATASSSVTPDRLGLYTLQLSGTKADGASASVLVILEAIDAPVFVRDLHVVGSDTTNTSTVSLSTEVAGAYGTAARTVGCPTTAFLDGGSGTNGQDFLISARMGIIGDSWEAPLERRHAWWFQTS